MKHVLIAVLTAYRATISRLYGDVCRFHPSCSAYALESVQRHGALGGTYLTVRRLAHCHPFHSGGYDPVPADWRHPHPTAQPPTAQPTIVEGTPLTPGARGVVI